jgi:hypothetical protein
MGAKSIRGIENIVVQNVRSRAEVADDTFR